MGGLHAHVVAAMSGGVDSSVAAAMLQKQGYKVTGVTLRLPVFGESREKARSCCDEAAIRDAQRVCDRLGIAHYVLDLRDDFIRTVLADFCAAYAEGRTPNPCVRCNDWIKFGKLLRKALALGADAVATGHYVRKLKASQNSAWSLCRGAAPDDQSYFLYSLSQQQLEHAFFPLGGLQKSEVRAMARDIDLPVHDRPDSQDLCFIPDGDYRRFLRARVPHAFTPGPIRHVSGKLLGEHGGVADFTVGQRRGLGIAWSEPLYVTEVDASGNTVVVGERRHVERSSIQVESVNWLVPEPRGTVEAQVKIRFNHPAAPARVTAIAADLVRVDAHEKLFAPCPGQSAVFYSGERVLGGGAISRQAHLEHTWTKTCTPSVTSSKRSFGTWNPS